jgi:exodeoxyribonuclease-1
MQTYLFYDIETTGLSKSFDQVLQFAAIRTDLNLQEIKRYEFKVKLNPDIVPAPRALITHQIGIEDAMHGMPEIDAIQQIHALLNAPGTISVGYNTLGFDDEFLRFSFYRNLLPPYSHQFANQCKRMDLYPITVIYHLFKKDILHWPIVDDKLSLRLEQLNRANNLSAGRAHDAMVDVEVTLALAKRFIQAREMWDYITDYFKKEADAERLQRLPADFKHAEVGHREGLMILGKFGAKENFQAPVLYLGESHTYKHQSLWLRLDAENLNQVTEDTIYENTWVIRKKMAEPPFILPLAGRFLKYLSPKRQALALANKLWLLQNPTLFQKIINYHQNYAYPDFVKTDIDANLYRNDFWNDADKEFSRLFHRALPASKALMTENLQNLKLKALAIRVLGRHYPESMTPSQQETYNGYLQQIRQHDEDVLIDFKGNKRLTAQAALADINLLRAESGLSSKQLELLQGLENYLKDKLN